MKSIKYLAFLLSIFLLFNGCWFIKGMLDPGDCKTTANGLECSNAFEIPENEEKQEISSISKKGTDTFRSAQRALNRGDHESASELFERSAQLFRKEKNYLPEVESYQQLMWLNRDIGDERLAAKFANRAERSVRKVDDNYIRAKVSKNVAELYEDINYYGDSINSYINTAQYLLEEDEMLQVSDIYYNIAALYDLVGNSLLANVYRDKAKIQVYRDRTFNQ